jgi:hypothetical protein
MHCSPSFLLQGGAAAGTALVFHTLHLPRLDAAKNDGTLAHATISRRSHVAQLNAAGRHLARRHSFQVGDYGHTCGRRSADKPQTCLDHQGWQMAASALLNQAQLGSAFVPLSSARFLSRFLLGQFSGVHWVCHAQRRVPHRHPVGRFTAGRHGL